MSYVTLLAASHPMPLYDPGLRRVSASGAFSVETPGFSIQPHEYYRDAVEDLDLNMKPYQYELDVQATTEEAALLRAYLEQHTSPGEQVELWTVWVGSDRALQIPHFRGRLADLDQEALEQLCNPPEQNGCPGQCRMTVTI